MKTIIGVGAFTATLLFGVSAFAQSFSVTGTGDAAAQNQLSVVGVGRGTGSGGPGYSTGIPGYGYGTPLYDGRSGYVPGAPYGYAGYGHNSITPYYPD